MEAGTVIALIALCLPAIVFATSLRLSNNIGLLVLDGKRVFSSLLRGADSIELENGRYQLVFRVGKTVRLSSHEERLYISPPLVISFGTQLVSRVSFRLPRLNSKQDATHFDDAPCVELSDRDSIPIPVKLDILSITSATKIVDYEVETERYNKAAKHASLPQFATMMVDDSPLLSGVSEPDRVPPQSQTSTEQHLKYWFQQAGAQTRSNFLQWVEKQPPL